MTDITAKARQKREEGFHGDPHEGQRDRSPSLEPPRRLDVRLAGIPGQADAAPGPPGTVRERPGEMRPIDVLTQVLISQAIMIWGLVEDYRRR